MIHELNQLTYTSHLNFTLNDLVPTNKEVQAVIRNLSNRKVPEHDRISNIICKYFPIQVISRITSLINAMFKHAYFPMHTFEKDTSDSCNCRLISLLPTLQPPLVKVIEYICCRFSTVINSKNHSSILIRFQGTIFCCRNGI